MSHPNNYAESLVGYLPELNSESVSGAKTLIWKTLLSKGQTGATFKRSKVIGGYMVDFFSAELGLIIEVDEHSHYSPSAYGRYRQNKFEGMGYKFLRFSVVEIYLHSDEVKEKILYAVNFLNK